MQQKSYCNCIRREDEAFGIMEIKLWFQYKEINYSHRIDNQRILDMPQIIVIGDG